MLDFSDFTLLPGDWLAYGGVLFLAVVAKILRQETRTLSLAIVACILVPSGATPYVVAVLAMVLRFIDMVRL